MFQTATQVLHAHVAAIKEKLCVKFISQ